MLINSTGDGFLVGIPTNATSDDRGVVERGLAMWLLDVAEKLVEACSRYESSSEAAPMRIRIGLHRGDYFLGLPNWDQFAVGIGLNWVARVASLGGDNQIIVSEEAVQSMVNDYGRDLLSERFNPRLNDEPLVLAVKHRRPASVRVLRRRAGSTVGRNTLPPKVREVQIIHDRIGKLVWTFLNQFHARLVERGINDAQPRITVWALGPDARTLVSTVYRCQPRQQSGIQRPSETCWPLVPAPVGPVAEAYHTRRRSVDTFPNTHSARQYARKWRKLKLTDERIRQFSRFSGTIFGIPLEIAPKMGLLEGVLCVDLAPNFRARSRTTALTGQKTSQWRIVSELVEEFEERYASTLAILLRLRNS